MVARCLYRDGPSCGGRRIAGMARMGSFFLPEKTSFGGDAVIPFHCAVRCKVIDKKSDKKKYKVVL
jgi:hypothetical protein